MRNRRLIFAFILSTLLSSAVGLLFDLVAAYIAPTFAPQTRLVYVVTGVLFVVSLPLSIYLFLRSPDDESATPSTSAEVSFLVSRPTIASNLPARGEFVGRQEEKQRVLQGLKSNYPLVVIRGVAGIGKTALAREVGWIAKEKSMTGSDDAFSFEAIIWIEDHDDQLTINELLDTIGCVLGYHQITQLSPIDKRVEILKRLHENPCLIIIDDFETVSDPAVEDFVRRIPAPTSRAIITSKEKVLQRDSWIVHLEEMNFEDKLALAQNEVRRLGTSVFDNQGSKTSLRELCKLIEGNPYLIRIKIGQIQAGIPFQTVLRTATDDDERLQPSWGVLQRNPTAMKVLMAISLFQSPPTLKDIEFVSEVTGTELSGALENLDLLLLMDVYYDEADSRRYSLHSRTKAFVTKKLLADQLLSQAIYRRMAEWIESYALKHGSPKNWNEYPMLDQQYATIMTTVEWCSRQTSASEKKRVLTIWRAIDHYMSVKGNMKDYVKLGDLVLQCAQSLGDLDSEIDVKVEVLGFAYMTESSRSSSTSKDKMETLEKAEALILQGLRAYQDSGDWAGVGTASRYLGMIAQERGDYGSAQKYFEDSLANFQLIPGWDNLGAVLSSLGILSLQQKDVQAAVEYQSRRLALAEALKNPEGMAVALYNLGRLAQMDGRDKQAIDFYRRALEAAHRASKNDVIAASQRRLGECILKQGGDMAEAKEMAQNAYQYYDRIGKIPDEMTALITELEMASRAQSKPWRRLLSHIRQSSLNHGKA